MLFSKAQFRDKGERISGFGGREQVLELPGDICCDGDERRGLQVSPWFYWYNSRFFDVTLVEPRGIYMPPYNQ